MEIPAAGAWRGLYFDVSGSAYSPSNVLIDKNGSEYVAFGYVDIAGGGYILKYRSLNEYGGGILPNTIDSLRQDSSGNIYGSAYGNAGGCDPNCNPGMLFKLTTAGVLTILHNFCSFADCADGRNPGNLTLDSDGNIFGESSVGVFKLSTSGTESTIYSSDSIAYGPGLLIDTSGNLYGATLAGGSGIGSVWQLIKN